MQKLIFKYLNGRCYVGDGFQDKTFIFRRDWIATGKFPFEPRFLLSELNIIFSLDEDATKRIVQIWATFLDIKNDLTKYWKSDSFHPKTDLMSCYGNKIVDPSYYGILHGTFIE